MQIQELTVGPIGTLCYILSVEGSDRCVIIDPGAEAGRIHTVLGARKPDFKISAVPSKPSTIRAIAVEFMGTFVRYAATRNHPQIKAAVFPKDAFVNVNSPPAFGYFGTIYA